MNLKDLVAELTSSLDVVEVETNADYEVVLDADTPYNITKVEYDHFNKRITIHSEPQ